MSGVVDGKERITEVLHGLAFDISMSSFFQTNPQCAERLYAEVVNAVMHEQDRLEGEVVMDLFCGTGTIPIETAGIGHNIASGIARSFTFESWPTMPVDLMSDLRSQAIGAQVETLEERLLGSDINGGILRVARENAQQAGVAHSIHFQSGDALKVTNRRRFGCLIANLPYGQNNGADWELERLYRSLPEVLRGLPTWSHYFLTDYANFEQAVGRQADRRRKLYNGRIECTYYQFHGPKRVTNDPDVADGAVIDPNDDPDDASPQAQESSRLLVVLLGGF